jgi:reverse gyrase
VIDGVLVGTDPEGEKFAWDVYLALRPFRTIERVEFRLVTPRAIGEVRRFLRGIAEPLVRPQIVCRALTVGRGFHSPNTYRDIPFEKILPPGGQTPVLSWMVVREEGAGGGDA